MAEKLNNDELKKYTDMYRDFSNRINDKNDPYCMEYDNFDPVYFCGKIASLNMENKKRNTEEKPIKVPINTKKIAIEDFKYDKTYKNTTIEALESLEVF